MTPTVIHVNFKLDMSGKEYEQGIASLAHPVADVPGLQWKIWLRNESSHEFGGICLFEDEDSANAFLHGPLFARIKTTPGIADLHVAQFAVFKTLTAITRGPVTSTHLMRK